MGFLSQTQNINLCLVVYVIIPYCCYGYNTVNPLISLAKSIDYWHVFMCKVMKELTLPPCTDLWPTGTQEPWSPYQGGSPEEHLYPEPGREDRHQLQQVRQIFHPRQQEQVNISSASWTRGGILNTLLSLNPFILALKWNRYSENSFIYSLKRKLKRGEELFYLWGAHDGFTLRVVKIIYVQTLSLPKRVILLAMIG